jgi:hypothetical protein
MIFVVFEFAPNTTKSTYICMNYRNDFPLKKHPIIYGVVV